jgi:hypothetical protein
MPVMIASVRQTVARRWEASAYKTAWLPTRCPARPVPSSCLGRRARAAGAAPPRHPRALTSFALGGLLYAPYTALSATLFQRGSPPALLSQVLAARGALTVLAAPLGTALGGPLVAFVGASNTLIASGAATILLGLIATVALSARQRAGQRRRSG